MSKDYILLYCYCYINHWTINQDYIIINISITGVTSDLLPSEQIVNPNGTVVVKRGRGRPPGTRNKATLIAQAKLLAQQQAKAKAAASDAQPTLQSPLLPARAAGAPTPSSTHRVTPPTAPHCRFTAVV